VRIHTRRNINKLIFFQLERKIKFLSFLHFYSKSKKHLIDFYKENISHYIIYMKKNLGALFAIVCMSPNFFLLYASFRNKLIRHGEDFFQWKNQIPLKKWSMNKLLFIISHHLLTGLIVHYVVLRRFLRGLFLNYIVAHHLLWRSFVNYIVAHHLRWRSFVNYIVAHHFGERKKSDLMIPSFYGRVHTSLTSFPHFMGELILRLRLSLISWASLYFVYISPSFHGRVHYLVVKNNIIIYTPINIYINKLNKKKGSLI
jgi:hypothetical protein